MAWVVMGAVLLVYTGGGALAILKLFGVRREFSGFVLASTALLLPLFAAEVYVQYFYSESDSYSWLSRGFARRHYQGDDFGLRDSGLPLSSQTPNLVIVGDSIVFGAGLTDPKARYSNLLQRMRPDLHVVTLATIGDGTLVETELLRRFAVPNAKTRAVVLNYAFNDILDALPEGYVERPPAQAAWRAYFESVELLRHLYYRWVLDAGAYDAYVSRRFADAYADEELLRVHTQQLRELAQVVEGLYRAPLLIVLWPDLRAPAYDPAYRSLMATGEGLGARVVDLVPTLQEFGTTELVVSARDRHPNAFANELVAKQVLRVIPATRR